MNLRQQPFIDALGAMANYVSSTCANAVGLVVRDSGQPAVQYDWQTVSLPECHGPHTSAHALIGRRVSLNLVHPLSPPGLGCFALYRFDKGSARGTKNFIGQLFVINRSGKRQS